MAWKSVHQHRYKKKIPWKYVYVCMDVCTVYTEISINIYACLKYWMIVPNNSTDIMPVWYFCYCVWTWLVYLANLVYLVTLLSQPAISIPVAYCGTTLSQPQAIMALYRFTRIMYQYHLINIKYYALALMEEGLSIMSVVRMSQDMSSSVTSADTRADELYNAKPSWHNKSITT